MRNLVIIFLSIFSVNLLAALPPLSEEERQKMASDIVSGYVMSLTISERELREGFVDHVFKVRMITTQVSKSEEISGGEIIEFSYWKAVKRPYGWSGDSGQYGSIPRYSSPKVYLKRDLQGQLQLLGPNGFNLPTILL